MNTVRTPADHYLKAADIAAIVIAPDGEVTACGTIEIDLRPAGFATPAYEATVERLAALARECRGNQTAIAAQLEELTADSYIGITPHRLVVDCALAAVDRVHEEMRQMQTSGGMKVSLRRRPP